MGRRMIHTQVTQYWFWRKCWVHRKFSMQWGMFSSWKHIFWVVLCALLSVVSGFAEFSTFLRTNICQRISTCNLFWIHQDTLLQNCNRTSRSIWKLRLIRMLSPASARLLTRSRRVWDCGSRSSIPWIRRSVWYACKYSMKASIRRACCHAGTRFARAAWRICDRTGERGVLVVVKDPPAMDWCNVRSASSTRNCPWEDS
jgi:hypothetical protein